jgi:hypothetical protein
MLASLIFVCHFVGDFIFQSDRIAINKSKDNMVLFEHALYYSLPFWFFGYPFMIITLCLHFCVDYVTSRLTSYLWKKEERHWFFTTIGADQMIHLISLFYFYEVLSNLDMIGQIK